MKTILRALAMLAALAVPEAVIGQQSPIAGVWKLVSYDLEFQDSKERALPLGEHPVGYLILAPEGRMMAYLEATNRKAPQTIEERAEAYRTLIAYTGRYRVDGNSWTTKVDGAWNVDWIGTDQERTFSIAGTRLSVLAQWNRNALYSNRMTRGRTIWERER